MWRYLEMWLAMVLIRHKTNHSILAFSNPLPTEWITCYLFSLPHPSPLLKLHQFDHDQSDKHDSSIFNWLIDSPHCHISLGHMLIVATLNKSCTSLIFPLFCYSYIGIILVQRKDIKTKHATRVKPGFCEWYWLSPETQVKEELSPMRGLGKQMIGGSEHAPVLLFCDGVQRGDERNAHCPLHLFNHTHYWTETCKEKEQVLWCEKWQGQCNQMGGGWIWWGLWIRWGRRDYNSLQIWIPEYKIPDLQFILWHLCQLFYSSEKKIMKGTKMICMTSHV